MLSARLSYCETDQGSYRHWRGDPCNLLSLLRHLVVDQEQQNNEHLENTDDLHVSIPWNLGPLGSDFLTTTGMIRMTVLSHRCYPGAPRPQGQGRVGSIRS